MIKLFVFDLGNVILPFEHHQIAAKLHETSLIKDRFTPDDLFRYLFDHQKGFVNAYEEGLISSKEFFKKLKEKYKLELESEGFKDIWNDIFQEDPAVSEIILYLKRKGYPIVLLSNTNELHFSYVMERYPIIHHFDEWILSFEVGAKKPKEKIYSTIFETRSVERNEVLYIDDIPEYITAAAGYGIPGIVFKEAADIWKVIRENCV
ncbi:MAG: HAD hydrolase-like protein [Syntrophorhabdaceae bacterium]|nr:HAD hydrolase-like protein [Syntrophorhabdaceae bacterium]